LIRFLSVSTQTKEALMRTRRIVFVVALVSVFAMALSCIPAWHYDRAATIKVDYVDESCRVTAYDSEGTEMDPLYLWPGRVVKVVNETDCVVTAEFPREIFAPWKLRLNPGAEKTIRVRGKAEHVDLFYYDVNCCVEPGSSIPSAGPKGQVGDDTGGP
jgi:hypothetical protein